MANRQGKHTKNLKWVQDRLQKAFGDKISIPERNVLDELVYNLLLQGSAKERAQKAFDAIKEEFHDWNEVRVTVPHTIADTIKGVGLEHVKSLRLVKILQGIFEDRSEADLEFLNEMNTEAIRTFLSQMEGIGKNSVETVLTFALGQGAFPSNKPALRFASRFGFVPDDTSKASEKKIKELIESTIEDDEMPEFVLLVEMHTEKLCKSSRPVCSKCNLSERCKFYAEKKKKKTGK